MSQQKLDYQSPLTHVRRSSHAGMAMIIVICMVLIVNGVLLTFAASDRSWGALGIAIMIGPIANGILLLLSLACIPIVKSGATWSSMTSYLAVAIGLPLMGALMDFFIIGLMDLHGC